MTVRILMTTDAVGGVWQYALELCAAMPDVQVTLAVLGPPADAAQCADAAAIGGLRLVQTGLPLDWLCDSADPVLAAGAALAELARATNVDMVHLNSPALAAGVRFDMPVLAVNHGCLGTWWDAAGKGEIGADLAWLPALTGAGLHAANRVVAPTRAYAETVAARYHLPKVPAVVHNGRARLPLPDGTDPFAGALTVGRLWDDIKGAAVLDAAAATLDAPIVAAGATRGPHGETFTAAHLRTTGPLSAADLGAWLARRPVFASAARFEPFGLAVLEAAQAACPLVLSDIATFRELWDGAAIFVPVGDVQGFAGAIATLLADPDMHIAAGAAAQTRSARYTAPAMAQAMLTHYRALLPPQGSGTGWRAA